MSHIIPVVYADCGHILIVEEPICVRCLHANENKRMTIWLTNIKNDVEASARSIGPMFGSGGAAILAGAVKATIEKILAGEHFPILEVAVKPAVPGEFSVYTADDNTSEEPLTEETWLPETSLCGYCGHPERQHSAEGNACTACLYAHPCLKFVP